MCLLVGAREFCLAFVVHMTQLGCSVVPTPVAKVRRERTARISGTIMSAVGKSRNHNLSKRPSETDVFIGGRLRLWRRTMDVDASALASRIGITYQQLQKYEKGMNRISAARLYAIAKELNVPVEYFYRDVDAESPGNDGSSSLEASQRAEQLSFLTNSKGADLLKQYLTIPKPEVRRALLALMRSIAAEGAVES